MKQAVKKLWILLLICGCVVNIPLLEVKAAASATTSVSGGDVEVGEEITVTVTISSRQSLGTYNLYVDYDADKLKFSDKNSGDFNGGGGRVKIVGGADTSEEKSASYDLIFIANKAGNSKISVSGSAYYFDEEAGEVRDMEVKSNSAKIKAKAPVVASNDNKLSSLSLQTDSASGNSTAVVLTPEFSPDVTEYQATFTYDVNKVIVSAIQSDPKATVAVTGTRIDLGDNITKIAVTAEDGSVREYIIRSVKTNDIPEEPTSEKDTEPTTPKPNKAEKNIYIEDMEKYLIIDISDAEIPEGFEESTYTYADKTVNVARGISKNLVLMYLADDEELTNAAFYIYDEADNSFYQMTNIQTDKKMYTIIKTPDSLEIPKGFVKKTVKINGTNVDSWVIEGNDEFYLVYAMNWKGKTGLYVYDRGEASMQRYMDAVAGNREEATGEASPNAGNSEEIESLYKTIDEIKGEYNNDRDIKWKVIIGLAVVCILLIILCIVLLQKLRDVEIIEEEEEISEDGGEPRELKLDMALQANEMSSGALAANIEDVVKEELGEMPTGESAEEIQEVRDMEDEEAATAEEVQDMQAATAEPEGKQPEPVRETVFVTPKEPEFIQPAEMRIVEPEVFEHARDVNSEKNQEEESMEAFEEEFTVSGLGFHDSDKPEKRKKNREPEPETEEIREEDDFEIEFVDINGD